MGWILLGLLLSWAWPATGQELTCTLREITRLADQHLLYCDGQAIPLSAEAYAAQLLPGGSIAALCPEGTTTVSLAGGSVQFDTASGTEEPCDAYTSPSDAAVTILFTTRGDIALTTARDLMRDDGKLHLRRPIRGLRVIRGQLLVDNYADAPKQRGQE